MNSKKLTFTVNQPKKKTNTDTKDNRKRIGKFKDNAKAYVKRIFDQENFDDPNSDLYCPVNKIEAESEFDLSKLVSASLDPVTGVPRDIKIPEGDFKEASSFFDFCLNFTSKDAKVPFSRQMWIMLSMFGEMCPRCTKKRRFTDILKSPVDYPGKNMDEFVQVLEYGKCPTCGGTKSDFFRNNEMNEYTELALCLGQRSGKSTTTSAGANYLLHKYLKFPRMSSVCRAISVNTPLSATFIGLRYSDAHSLLWMPIHTGVKESPWFQEYHKMMDHYGKLHGLQFYRFNNDYIRYANKNIELYPSGPTKRGLRGRTRWLSAVDEIGWFPIGLSKDEDEESERADAEGVYAALDRSLLTLREEVSHLYTKGYANFLQAYNINISSPSAQGDMITRLVDQNIGSDSCLALRLATWEVNPTLPRTSKRISAAYRKNPVDAERDYGANPPMNSRNFINKSEAIRAFTLKNGVTIKSIERRIGDNMRQAAIVETSSPPTMCLASLMSIDAGLTNNSFAITILQIKQTKSVENIDGKNVEKTVSTLSVPAIVEIQPKPGHILHYSVIYKGVIKKLIKDWNVRFLFADRWNSRSLLDVAEEDFQHMQLTSGQYSVKYVDFLLTRSYVQDGRLFLPALEMPEEQLTQVDNYPSYFQGKPAAHLMFQFMTVRDMGKTVIKGHLYTDDIFRALVLGVSRILDPKIQEQLLLFNASITRDKFVGAIASSRTGAMVNVGLLAGVQRGSSSVVTPVFSRDGQNMTQSAVRSLVVRANRSRV